MGEFPQIFDSSMLASFKSCPELFRKAYIEDWKAKAPSVHLHAGASFARGLEVARTAFYANGASAEDAIAEGLRALLCAYGDFECPSDSAKSAARTAGAFEFYFANYPLVSDEGAPIVLPGGKRAIEFSFAQPLPLLHPTTNDPLLYVGRMDAVINYAGGTYICDEKTTSYLGGTWSRQWDLRAQFTGYAWGCAASGIRVDGAIVRGVSILKTKYETQQAISYRPEWQIDRWYNEMLGWIREIMTCWRIGEWRHSFDHACTEYGGCAFRQACASQDETPWLETSFQRRHWNPLLRTETIL